MTSSTGCRGLTFRGSPPSFTIPSRIAARSTTAGTPVKSCRSTRAGVNAISFCVPEQTSHPASAWMSSGSTNRASSRRSGFSRRIFSEYGRRETFGKPAFSRAGRLKMWNVSAPTVIGVRELNEFCEAMPRYSSSRGARFKRPIGNLDDEEQQIKWANGWLDTLLFNREERRWGGTHGTGMLAGQLRLLAPRERGGARERARNRERYTSKQAFAISRPLSHSSARPRRAREQRTRHLPSRIFVRPPVLSSSL